MESIKKFQDCKIQNMAKIYGGYSTNKKMTDSGHNGVDKYIYDDEGKLRRMRTHCETWFHRD